ncbi:cytoplasmic polyadenylation element-binding protein 2 isoform X2 [Hoplias malabaricus]|uniref:cytoplasmic polyadenylation element-binding protein 2 isoform X2 n=1 Tax=Hoplias malabaricus TaxID=27720 RepID=UPI003461A3AA
MGDYGFGLLHTAGLSSSSSNVNVTSAALLFGGATFRSVSAAFFSDEPSAVTGSQQFEGGVVEGKGAGDDKLALSLARDERQRSDEFEAFCPASDLQEPQPSSSASSSSGDFNAFCPTIDLKTPQPLTLSSASSSGEDLTALCPAIDLQEPQPPSSAPLFELQAEAPAAEPEAKAPPPANVTKEPHLRMDLSNGLAAGFQDMASGAASPPLPGFAAPWSVHSSSPPPGPQPQPPPPSSEPDNGLYPALSPGLFPGFSPCAAAVNVSGLGGPFSPQPPPPQSRRSPGSTHTAPPPHGAFLQQRNNYNHHQPLMKQSLWGGPQGSGWSSGGVCWGRDHRRGGGMGVPGSLSQISPMKKPFSSSVIAPPKFPRSTASLGPKTWVDENVFRTDNNSNTLLPLQDRSRMYDSLNMHSLESSLIDIIRAEQDPLKGRIGCPHPGGDGLLMLNGRSSLFPIEDGFLDDGHGNQGVPGVLGSPNYPHQNGERIERFSRKVFVGGLPPDIDEDEITSSFRRFGHLVVDWPHKAESKSYFPPKGYAFLLFQEETSVQALIEACLEEDGKLYLCVSSPTIKDKPVQIRPWNLSDSDFVMDGSQPLDPRKTIFVGGVPRPLRAAELAMIMDRLYGGVCYAGIDTDPELKYPKGAGRVAFSNQQSYIAAISARFVQLQHGDIDKRVEVKPYVLDDQLCDECQGARCGGKFAPFFCANVTCLQYYCEFCWANIHSRAGREFHKPLVKEGADRPRQIHFRWN